MSPERRIEGLALKVGPLGEHDRLLTLLSDDVGLIRLAVPGARKPRSSLAAAVPLTTLELQVGGRSGLLRVRQLRVQHNFGNVGQRLETLAAAQALSELSIALVAGDDPVPGMLSAVLMHLERLELTGAKSSVNLSLEALKASVLIEPWQPLFRAAFICSLSAVMASLSKRVAAVELPWLHRSGIGTGAAACWPTKVWPSVLKLERPFRSTPPNSPCFSG